MTKKNLLFIATFFLSLSTFVMEIVLTRIFSVTVHYHFAFLVISLVMFGFAFGGVILFIFERFFLKYDSKKILTIFSLLHILSLLPVIFIVPRISFSVGFASEAWLPILVLFLVCVIPFTFTGLILSHLFFNLREESGKLYFFDLTGASAGAIAAVFALNFLGGVNSLIFAGLLGAVAFLLFASHLRNNRVISLAAVILLFFIAILSFNYKYVAIDIKKARGKYLSRIFLKWNAFSMVRVYGDEHSNEPNVRGWGMSSAYKGGYSPQLNMDIDAGAYTPIVKYDGDDRKVEFLKYDVTSFAYYLKSNPKALVIGPGGGRDILTASIFGSEDITGVEVNPIIVNDVMRNRFKDYSGNIYERKNIHIVVDDARSFIKHSKEKYDIIQTSLVDTFAATNAGAYSLTENNLYTLEAITEYLKHLSHEGILTISWWRGPMNIKLIVLYLLGAERVGIADPSKNLAIIKNKKIVNNILKKTPFTTQEIAFIKQKAKMLNYEILYVPTTKADKNSYQRDAIFGDPYMLVRKYQEYNLKPSTDDCPYFFNVKRIRDVPKIFTGESKDIGLFALYSLLLTALLMISLLILLPIYIRRGDAFKTMKKNKFITISYFACLGVGFMLVEISLLQKFILFLGHPTYSITVIIFSLLMFGGIGSYLTSKLSEHRIEAGLLTGLAAVAIVVLLYNLFINFLFASLIGSQVWVRISISTLLLGILGIFMGMPFPLGVRITGIRFKKLIPFCWAVNGAGSVIGSIMAVILSMNIGFTNTLHTATVIYLLAFLLIWFLKKRGVSSETT